MELPIIYHPDYVAPLPEGHRFPMSKFRQLYQLLIADGVAKIEQFHTPQPPPTEWIQLVHTADYIQAYYTGTPVASVIGGGYSDDINALIFRHSLLHRAATEVYRQYL